jgi:hypothetical protein
MTLDTIGASDNISAFYISLVSLVMCSAANWRKEQSQTSVNSKQ